MEMIDEKIKELIDLKKKWDEKRIEQIRYILEYNNPTGDLEYLEECKARIKEYSDELNKLGQSYHEEIMKVAKDLAKDYQDNPIIDHLIDGIDKDVDPDWNVFHGNREERLRFLADVIEEFKKLFKHNTHK